MANLGDLRKIVYKTIEDTKTGLSASQIRIATFSDTEFAGTFYISVVTSESTNNDYTFSVDLSSKSGSVKYSLRNATRLNTGKFGIYVDGSNSVFLNSVGTNIVTISVRKEIKYGSLLETSSLSTPSPLLGTQLFENLDMSSSNLFKTLFVEGLTVDSITAKNDAILIESNIDSSLEEIHLFPNVETIVVGGNGEDTANTNISIPGDLSVQGTITFANDQVYDKINIVGEFVTGFFPFKVVYREAGLVNPDPTAGETIFYINHLGNTQIKGNLDVDGQTTDLLNTNIVGNAVLSSGYLQADNIRIDANTISSTNTNGNITLDPNGLGAIELSAPTSADSLSVSGAATIGSTLDVSGNTTIGTGTNASLSVVGPISTSSKLTVADTTIVSNDVTLLQSSDLRIIKGGSRYFNEDINTLFTWNGMVWVGVVLPTSEPVPPPALQQGDRYFDETSNTLFTYINGSWFGEVLPTLTQAPTTSVDINGDSGNIQTIGNISILGDIAANGGDITTSSTSASVFDANATTVNAFGAATTANIGYDGSASSTTNISTGVIGSSSTKTLNLGTSSDAGGSTLVNIGASGAGAVNSIVNIYGTLNVSGKVNTINTEEINISDNKIILNSDLNDTPGSGWFGGIEIKTGAATSQTLLWDHGQTRWEIDGSPIATKDLTLGQFAATTSNQLASVISDETGSGALVFATSPTLETPTLGAAAATSINKVAITAPATGATLTIANGKELKANKTITLDGVDGKTLNINKTITLEADQDSRTVNFGAGTTSTFRVAYSSDNLGLFSSTTSAQLAGVISDKTGYTSGAKLMFSDSPEVNNLQVGTGIQLWEFDATTASNLIIKSGSINNQVNAFTLSSSGALTTLGTISSPSLVSTSIAANVITLTQYQGSPLTTIRVITADSAGNLFVGNGSTANQVTTLGNGTNGTGNIVRTTDATFATHPVGTRDNRIATTNFVGNELEWSLFGYTTTNITTADFDITAGPSGNLFINSSTRSDQFDIENFDYKFVYFGSANSEVSSTNVDIGTANVIKLRLNNLAERKRYAWISQRIVRGLGFGGEGNFEDTLGTTGEFDSDFSNAIGTLVTLDDVSFVANGAVGVTYIKMEFVVSESYANSTSFNSGVIMVEGEGSAIFSTTDTTDASWQGTKSGSSKAWFTGTVKGITDLTVLNFRNTVGAATSSIKVQKVQVYKRRRIR